MQKLYVVTDVRYFTLVQSNKSNNSKWNNYLVSRTFLQCDRENREHLKYCMSGMFIVFKPIMSEDFTRQNRKLN